MRKQSSGKPLGQFAEKMLGEVEADREVLARLTERVGGTAGGMKEWGAWLAEKVSRLKLKHGPGDRLGTFEALEFLVIGIHGKRALWRAMAEVASFDARLQEFDFGELIARAENQHAETEEKRLRLCAVGVPKVELKTVRRFFVNGGCKPQGAQLSANFESMFGIRIQL